MEDAQNSHALYNVHFTHSVGKSTRARRIPNASWFTYIRYDALRPPAFSLPTQTTNQNPLFGSRNWLLTNQGPVFPDLPKASRTCPAIVQDVFCGLSSTVRYFTIPFSKIMANLFDLIPAGSVFLKHYGNGMMVMFGSKRSTSRKEPADITWQLIKG